MKKYLILIQDVIESNNNWKRINHTLLSAFSDDLDAPRFCLALSKIVILSTVAGMYLLLINASLLRVYG